MAISAVSSISGGGYLQLYRSFPTDALEATRAAGNLSRLKAIPPLAVREDSQREGAGSRDRPLSLDPRGAESLIQRSNDESAEADRLETGRAEARKTETKIEADKVEVKKTQEKLAIREDTRREDTRREVRTRLDDLLGQKSSMERKQAQEKGERSAAIVNELSQLKSRDSAVRAHEAAHMAAGGSYVTGGATYTYQRGPDGAEYAVGGEVGIDTSAVPGKPEETVQKMRTIRAAALAPSDPSSADIAVASAAAQEEAAALAEIAQARTEELAGQYARVAGDAAGRKAGTPPREPLDMVA